MSTLQAFILGAAVTAAIFTIAIIAAMRRVCCWNVLQRDVGSAAQRNIPIP